MSPMSPEQKSLFDEEEDATIKFPNSHARGKFSFAQKDVLRGGKRIKTNAFTLNAAKVSDSTTQLLQQHFKGRINYYDIRKQVEDELHPFFEEYGLLDYDPSNKRDSGKKKRLMNIKIEEEIKTHIKSSIKDDCTMKIPFHDFFENLDIDSMYYKEGAIRFNRAIELVLEVQSKSYCDYTGKRVEVDESGNLQEVGYVGKSALVPTIEFEFDEALGEINKIEDLIASRKKNKAQYIKAVVLKFDPETFASLVSPGREYVITTRKLRNSFETVHAFRLDSLVRSIEKIQHYTSVNRYTLDDLNALFGVSYKIYRDFKKRILIPSCDEFNKCEDLFVEFIEVKKHNKMDHIKFIITRKENMLVSGEYKEFDLPFYIAVQHFYFDEYINEDLGNTFQHHYQEIKFHTDKIESKKEYVYGGEDSNDKTLSKWEKEHEEALECYKKLVIFTAEDKKWFNEKKIKLCAERLCFVEADSNELYEPYKGLFDTHNPIKAYNYYMAEKSREKEKS